MTYPAAGKLYGYKSRLAIDLSARVFRVVRCVVDERIFSAEIFRRRFVGDFDYFVRDSVMQV